jgi:hypothetical protein
MAQHNDFDMIPTPGEQGPRRRSPNWVWLAVIVGVILLAFAAGMAFATFATRMNENNSPTVTPVPSPTPAPLANAPVSVTLTATTNSPAIPATPLPATVAPTTPAPLTPTVTVQTVCSYPVQEQFAPAYVQSELGCPTDAGAVVWAAWEPFERGAMLWRSDTDRAYAFFADGLWLTIDERWDNKEIPSRGEPPPGLAAPIRGFGYAWAVRDELFQRLGWATAEEKGFCARVQSFEGGFILQSDTVEFCREQLYNQARAPDWTPLHLVALYNGSWRPLSFTIRSQ